MSLDLFSKMQARPHSAPIFRLTIPGRLPSWNQVLAMEHWARKKFKDGLARDFLSALQAAASDCSTRTICAKSTTLIYADTLKSCLATRRANSKLRSAKLKLSKVSRKK